MNIARVDKATGAVSALGSGLNGRVMSMVAIGSDLYVGGEFSTAGGGAATHIAKWNGTTWSAVGGGVDSWVLSLVVMGSDLYAGGYFSTAGGVTVNGVAKWNGTAWSAVGGGVTGTLYSLHVAGGDLYVGGDLTAAGAVPVANIAKWNGSAWSALGTGSAEPVTAIGVAGGSVFAGKENGGLSRWNGTAWSILDEDLSSTVSVITPVGDAIYVGGMFTGSLAAYRLEEGNWQRDHEFTGMGFPRLGGIEEFGEYPVHAVVHDSGALYVGGKFFRVASEDEAFSEIAEFSAVNAAKIVINNTSGPIGRERSPVVAGDGLTSFGGDPARGYALLDTGDDVFVGGEFKAAGTSGRRSTTLTSAMIVRWNKATRTWHSPILELPGNQSITSFAKVGSTIYGASQSGAIYRYENAGFGESWEYFAEVNGPVRTLAAHSGKLIVGGRFTELTSPVSVTASSLVSFDGTTWAPMGSGIASGGGGFLASIQGAYSMVVNGGDLYVGGDFTTVGGVAAVDVAKWNGTTWSAVGGGISTEQFSTVNALAFGGGKLYAGGYFTSASGTPAERIAQWDGSAWSALGSGVNGDVYGIAISGTSLYAVGSFYNTVGMPAEGIAKWDGTQWSAVGAGLSSVENGGAITADGTSLFVTGGFTKAGGIPSHGFAEYGPVAAAPAVITLIDDKFDNGDIATNTLGTGNGFLNGSQQPVTESGGFANFNNGGVSTEVIASNPLDAANPFQPSATTLTFTYGDISHTSTSVRQRLWLGYRRTGPVGFVYYPGAIGSSFGSGRQGLYVSVLSQNVGEDGYTSHGNLVATNDSGVRTTLASWTWADPAQLSGLVVKLTTTATHYQLEFSGAAGGVPTYTFGAGNGLISGMGTVLPTTKFDIGGMNQYFGGSGGQARLDSVLLQRSIALATVAFTNATPSANPVNASAAPNIVPVELTRTDNTTEAITAQVVPGQPATTPSGFAKYVYGTDYEFVSGTAAGSTVSFAAGQTTATVNIQLKSPVLTKKGQFTLTLASLSGANFIGSPAVATVTINARDTVLPTVVVNTPVAGATFDITGTVKDAGGLSAFSVKVNGVTLPLTVNPLTGYVANSIAPYSVLGAIAENGPNIVTVIATDASGNTTTATKTVTYVNNRPTLAGTYTAVLNPSGTPDGDLAGFVTVTVSATGVTTGKLTISGATVSFSGLVSNAGAVMFKPNNSTALDLVDESEFDAYLGALSLTVSPSGLAGSLTTQASGGTTLATLSGVKTPYSSTNLVPAGLLTAATKGVYTVAFPSKEQSPAMTASAYPQGDGYATLTLTNAGVVTIIGRLADGTPLTASANLRADGKVAFFDSLYKKLGFVVGELTFEDLANSDVSGSDLLWVRPVQKTGRYYRFGWENGIRIDALGAKYTSPAALDFGQGAVNTVNGNAALVFTDGQLAATITHNVNVNPTTGAVTTVPVAGAPYKLTLTTGTGVFSGTFTHGGATDKYYGVLINKGGNKAGFGYFLSTVPLIYGASGESGGVTLQP